MLIQLQSYKSVRHLKKLKCQKTSILHISEDKMKGHKFGEI